MAPLLALLSPAARRDPDAHRQASPVAWSAVAPVLVLIGGALLLLVADAAAPPQARPPACYAAFTVRHRAGGHRLRHPAVEPGARRRARPVLHAPPGRRRRRLLGVRHDRDLPRPWCSARSCSTAGCAARAWTAPSPTCCMLLSASGGVMMASANDLIVMFLGLEILSIAVYVLAAMHLRKITSQEAGVKYFVLGAFSSAFFLYGIALIYGGTGSTNLVDISTYLSTTVGGEQRPGAGRRRPCCWSASASRWRPCRSTSGPPTCTRAPRARAWRGWPRA